MNTDTIVGFEAMREVNTKYGMKPIFGVRLEKSGTLEFGFKHPTKSGLTPGMSVDFTQEVKYGKPTIVSMVPAGTTIPLSMAPIAWAGTTPPTKSFNRGVFPIPIDSGERAILRQNALTNAREMVCSGINASTKTLTTDESLVDRILSIASKFEAYTSGDVERREAEKAVAEMKKPKEA